LRQRTHIFDLQLNLLYKLVSLPHFYSVVQICEVIATVDYSGASLMVQVGYKKFILKNCGNTV